MSDDTTRGGGLRPLRASLETWTPGRGREIDPLHAIAAAWPGIVGANVASNSSPLELVATNLVVGTRSSAWSQQLQFLSMQILTRLRELPCGVAVERMTFRTGLLPRVRRRTMTGAISRKPRPRTTRNDPRELPAADVFEAFERLRTRMSVAALKIVVRCNRCGAAREAATASDEGGRCAPCEGEADSERRTFVERLVYMAPWLTALELREQVPDLRVAEFERARKLLLARWWLVLERARLAGRVSPSGIERHVGSSYVLLQSRLPPDRITPAVVQNLLGADLEKLLWPHAAGAVDVVR